MHTNSTIVTRRRFLLTTGLAAASHSLASPIAAATPTGPTAATTSRLRVQRLAWAGLRIDLDDTTLFVDPTQLPDVPVGTEAKNRLALITHHHSDHFAPAVLKLGLGDKGVVFVYKDSVAWMDHAGLRIHPVELHQPHFIPNFGNRFVVTAVPAVDGFGHPQVSWVIEANGRKIFHGGDTLWHGHWWDIAQVHGPFDVVFLPINGFRMPRGRFKKTEVPMDLTPEQAASAAWILDSGLAVPMHYGATKDPEYIEEENSEQRFLKAAANHGVPTRVVQVGEWIEL